MEKKEKDPGAKLRSVERLISERAQTPSVNNDW